jgi:regulator of sigma E protease
MLTLGAFLLAMGVLVAVHEWGHFQMARLCGVKVLQFSVGFGPKLFGWRSGTTGIDYRLGLLPLGGYVRMLDEREAPVQDSDLPRSFNRQPLRRRFAIVLAGPLANLLLAWMLYALVHWVGVEQPLARIAQPQAASLAQRAGLQGGELVLQAGLLGQGLNPVQSFEDLRWWLAKAVIDGQDLELVYQQNRNSQQQNLTLPLSGVDGRKLDASMFRSIGITEPFAEARIGDILSDSAASRAGLKPGDVVLRVNQLRVADAGHLRSLIRESGRSGSVAEQEWEIVRGREVLHIPVLPVVEQEASQNIGRVGAMIGAPPAMVLVRSGFWQGMVKATQRSWEVSVLTLQMLERMLTGQASLRNISGPVTIADYAGRSAAAGAMQFVGFLALLSVSLCVMNLLPLPVLDGGHLMYYLWESATGSPVSDKWQAVLQRFGLAVLMAMMSVALFNDLNRLLF